MEHHVTPPEQPDPATKIDACAYCKTSMKKKITKPEWALLALLAIIFLISACGPKITEYLNDWQRSLIKSQMVALAEQGKPDAVLWVMQYVPESRSPKDLEHLKAFAEHGHAESMYRYSNYLFYSKDEAAGLAMLQKAADAGNPNAVRALHERNSHE